MLSTIRSVHFVGICGTAMASTAAAMQERGYQVSGSDSNVYPPMSTFLSDRKIQVFSGYSESHLSHRPDLVIIGNAIGRGNPEAEAVLERKMRYCSLPELLKEFFIRGKRCLVVAGTHGKTTTTSLLTWVFEHSGLRPSYLIGGIPNNLSQGARFTDSEWFIIEGDEYDTAFFDKRSKFVHYLPEVAIINNLELDHADIFENVAAVQTSFKRLIVLVPRNGLVLANGDDSNLAPLLEIKHAPVRRYGLGEGNDFRATALDLSPDGSSFSVGSSRFRIPLVGELNVRNALAVAACALHCGLTDVQIQAAFDTFQGVKRRMEVRGVRNGVTVIDDFAHHPTAIRETLKALKVRFPAQPIWSIFEPRTNSTRRNVFQEDLVTSFDDADHVVVAAIANPELIPADLRLDPEKLTRQLKARGKDASFLPGVDAIVDHLGTTARSGEVVCVFTNGGFGNIHQRLLDRFAVTT
jgi:UDP-N-acetylmuramate: L-alanyl-gamma-D-glutamyl-meso-diaminopimelate ligase